MKILLHICCGPCLIGPLSELRDKKLLVTGFFYNPNIYPLNEYNNRKKAALDLAAIKDLEVVCPDYDPETYSGAVAGHERPAEQRCPICWRLRLKAAAQKAKDGGFDYFSSTLLVSPYQDQDILKSLGKEVAKETGVEFYYQDFRPLFKQAHQEAKAQGIYCQKYCGCVYSLRERNERNK